MNKRFTVIGQLFKWVILVSSGASMLLPFFWLLLSALKSFPEYIALPPVFIPKVPQWHNLIDVLRKIPFFDYYFNSLTVSGSIALLVLITGAMGGFALGKYEFRGRDMIFKGILGTMILPSFIFYIPVYYLMRHFPLAGGNNLLGSGGNGLLHSHLSLILPFAVSPWAIFLIRQFVIGLPNELFDAARIDGCSDFRIFREIVLPLIKPALATVAIITFITNWNNLFWPLIVCSSAPELTTIPVGLKLLETTYNWGTSEQLILAGVFWGTIPVLILFASLQKYYIKGITMTGIK